MEYIEEALGVRCTRKPWAGQRRLPYFLLNEYDFEELSINGQECILLKPQASLAPVNAIKKHLKHVREQAGCPVALELASITKQRKASFIEARIPFIIPGKQLYLPFLGAILSERNSADAVASYTDKLMPSAQMLFLAFVLGKNQPLYLTDAAQRFGITPMSTSRAASQLVSLKLVERKSQGVRRYIASEMDAKELFVQATPFLFNPVRREVYINRDEVRPSLFYAGLTALSGVSMLNPPPVPVYGTAEREKDFKSASVDLLDSDTSAVLQVWRYDPRLISQNDDADALSLYMSLADSNDERIEQALEEMLQKVF